MKESDKDKLKKADLKDKVIIDNIKTLHDLQAGGMYTDMDEEFVKSDKMIDQLLYPYDVGEEELPPVVGANIIKSPGTGRFSFQQKIGAIWLMQVLLDKDNVPRYKIVKMATGIGVNALKNFWKNKQKWIEYSSNFTNTSLKVIKMNFSIALLKSSTALLLIDYNRLATSKDSRDQAALLKITEGLATRIALADSLFNAMDATDATEAIEGEAGVLPVAPQEIVKTLKKKKEKDVQNDDLQADQEQEEAE
ncbi:MAG TPA: hypothetical protein ENH82_08165 [bacterium]|nr:hypothetical protein [bacterium]